MATKIRERLARPMPTLGDQALADIMFIDSVLRMFRSGGPAKELGVWRAAIVRGEKKGLSEAQRARCHDLANGRQRELDEQTAEFKKAVRGVPFECLPKLPPGMSESSPRHGGTHR